MNRLSALIPHIRTLEAMVEQEPQVFAAIKYPVTRLASLLTESPNDLTLAELNVLLDKIGDFYIGHDCLFSRPSPDAPQGVRISRRTACKIARFHNEFYHMTDETFAGIRSELVLMTNRDRRGRWARRIATRISRRVWSVCKWTWRHKVVSFPIVVGLACVVGFGRWMTWEQVVEWATVSCQRKVVDKNNGRPIPDSTYLTDSLKAGLAADAASR